MNLSLSLSLGGSSLTLDPDARAYIAAVEAADGQSLEPAVRIAYDQFIRGCKADTFAITSGDVVAGSAFRNWDRIKASCILAGARTLDGALVPLVGAAPSNNNFLPADYVRATGLKGNGSTKFLNSNRNNNADPQDNNHNALWVSEETATSGAHSLMASGASGRTGNEAGTNLLAAFEDKLLSRSRSSTGTSGSVDFTSGFVGSSRGKSSDYRTRVSGVSSTVSVASNGAIGDNIFLFSRPGNFPNPTDYRLAYYSIGEALDLAALDARLATLTAAIASALA